MDHEIRGEERPRGTDESPLHRGFVGRVNKFTRCHDYTTLQTLFYVILQ